MGTPSLVRHNSSVVGSTPSTTLAVGGAVSIGDLILVAFRFGDVGETITISDNVNTGNYTQDALQVLAADGDTIILASKIANASGTPTLTFASSSAVSMAPSVAQWTPGSGNTWQPASQVSAGGNASSTAVNSGSIATSLPNGLLWTGAAFENTTNQAPTAAGTTTLLDIMGGTGHGGGNLVGCNGYQLIASTSTYSGQFTLGTAEEWGAIMAFYPYSSAISLTGQTSTSSEGTVARAVSYALTAQIATFTEGTISASTGSNVSRSLIGQTLTSSEGAFALNIGYVLNDGVPLTGQSATFTEGAPTGAVSYSLAGQTVTSTEGVISVNAGGNVTLTLVGQSVTFAHGTIQASASYVAAGQSITSTEGALSRAIANVFFGQAATFTEGVISRSETGPVTISLTGLQAAFAMGTITVATGIGTLIMPNLIGTNYYEALLTLELAGIYVPGAAYGFTPSTIKVTWQKVNALGGLVTAQSVSPGAAATANMPITLTISAFSVSSSLNTYPDWKQVN